MGDHVERPDYWHIVFKNEFDRGSSYSFQNAIEEVEEHYGIRVSET